MPSATYNIFRDAILREKQVTCWYGKDYREVCPIIIGHTDAEEKVLTYQFGGTSGRGRPVGTGAASTSRASATLACATAPGMKAPPSTSRSKPASPRWI
jgi:hypothetical protein